jgi:hypothetical protein
VVRQAAGRSRQRRPCVSSMILLRSTPRSIGRWAHALAAGPPPLVFRPRGAAAAACCAAAAAETHRGGGWGGGGGGGSASDRRSLQAGRCEAGGPRWGRRGEEAAYVEESAVPSSPPGSLEYMVTCHPGLEGVVAEELRDPRIGAAAAEATQPGRVSFWWVGVGDCAWQGMLRRSRGCRQTWGRRPGRRQGGASTSASSGVAHHVAPPCFLEVARGTIPAGSVAVPGYTSGGSGL